jgi:hypothetical protein
MGGSDARPYLREMHSTTLDCDVNEILELSAM